MATQQQVIFISVCNMATQQQVIFISVCYGSTQQQMATQQQVIFIMWLLNSKWYLLVFVMATQQASDIY